MEAVLRTVFEYIEMGGFIMWPLVVATFALWYALGLRFVSLQRGSVRSVRVLVERCRGQQARAPRGVIDGAVMAGLRVVQQYARHERLRRLLDDAFAPTQAEIGRGRALISSIVAVAPLAGLLGTVTGMIETFDSLGDMTLYSQSGGIAGGISQALFTTQMGLSIAVPGLIAGKALERRQHTIEHELEQLKDILCIEVAPALTGEAKENHATA